MAALLVLGLAVGLVMALTGAGGGVLAVPLLMFVTGLPVQAVSSIGLLAVALAAALGAFMGLRAGEVRYKAALLMSSIGLLLSPAGLWIAGKADPTWLAFCFSGVLLWVAFNAFRATHLSKDSLIDAGGVSEQSRQPCIQSQVTGRFIWTLPCARALMFSGGLAGFLSGLLGVGGGFVLVPALQRFTNLETRSVAVTSLAVIAIVSTFGVLNSAGAGAFNAEIGLPFAGAALTGMVGGRFLGGRIAEHQLKRIFGLLCLLVSGLLIMKSI